MDYFLTPVADVAAALHTSPAGLDAAWVVAAQKLLLRRRAGALPVPVAPAAKAPAPAVPAYAG